MATFTKIYTTSDAKVGGNLSITGSFAPVSINLSATSNQIVMGTTNTTTISATAPGASSTYTIPDVGTTGNFILSSGTQSITGTKTLTTPKIFDVGGGANTYNIVPSSLAGTRNITLPVLDANDTFVFLDQQQSIGNKVLNSCTLSGQTLIGASGIPATPNIGIIGSTSTGIYSGSANTLNFSSLGLQKLIIDPVGLTMNAGTVLKTGNVVSRITDITGATLVITLANASDFIVASGTGLTVSLPTGPSFDGIKYTFLRQNLTGDLIINRTSNDTIDDGVSTSLTLTTRYQRVSLQYVFTYALWVIV